MTKMKPPEAIAKSIRLAAHHDAQVVVEQLLPFGAIGQREADRPLRPRCRRSAGSPPSERIPGLVIAADKDAGHARQRRMTGMTIGTSTLQPPDSR